VPRKAYFYKAFSVLILTLSFSLFSFAQETFEGAKPAWQKGNPNAKVAIEVFNDYQCPMCAVFDKNLTDILRKYPNEVLIVFRNFPLTMIHPKAMSAAKVVEAAGIQGKFREMMQLIYRQQKKWSESKTAEKDFIRFAKKLDLNIEKFKSDLESQAVSDRIKADTERAGFLQLTYTPTVFINSIKLDVAEFEKLEAIIEKQLRK
jgi:protein-disulfide isomerase